MIESFYGKLPQAIAEHLASIKLLVCDVDGVFSDGRIYLGNNNEEYKAFHSRDGLGVKTVVKHGIDVAVITGRKSEIVQNRMSALNVKYIVQGCEEKGKAIQKVMQSAGVSESQVAVIGDDLPDIGMMKQAALRIAVADAHPIVKHHANWILTQKGGFGAVREVCDFLLLGHGALDDYSGVSG